MNSNNKKEPWWMLRNSAGKKDFALTLTFISFIVCSVMALLGSITTLTFGAVVISFNPMDPIYATTIFLGSAGLYFGRRTVDTQKGLYDTQSLVINKSSPKDKMLLEEETNNG